jgi:hypothetical protein
VLPLQLGGEISGQSLEIFAYPNEDRLKFMLTINYPPVVWRLCFDHLQRHTNQHRKASDGVPLAVRGPHHHPWPQNRRFAKSARKAIRLKNAIELPSNLTAFRETLEWFCVQTNIEFPSSHQIDLPPKEVLI